MKEDILLISMKWNTMSNERNRKQQYTTPLSQVMNPNKHTTSQSTHPPPSSQISLQSTLPPTPPSARRLPSAATALSFPLFSYSLQFTSHFTRRHRAESPSRSLTHRLRYRLRQHIPFLSFPAEPYVYRDPPYVTSDICCPRGHQSRGTCSG